MSQGAWLERKSRSDAKNIEKMDYLYRRSLAKRSWCYLLNKQQSIEQPSSQFCFLRLRVICVIKFVSPNDSYQLSFIVLFSFLKHPCVNTWVRSGLSIFCCQCHACFLLLVGVIQWSCQGWLCRAVLTFWCFCFCTSFLQFLPTAREPIKYIFLLRWTTV